MQHASVSLIEEQPAPCHQETGVRSDGQVIARSAAMRDILDLVRKIAATDVPVLILGEMGAGKHALAREIHRRSPRAARPFVRVACGALRESELDEKLFGRSCDRAGEGAGRPASLWEASRASTLLLDGVEQLPFWAQVKLLDAFGPGRGRSWEVGGPAAAEVRLIASSTCDLQTAVVENRFYSGLYYHLDAVRIDVPPLRRRQEDIAALAEHFLAAAVSTFRPPRNQLPWRFSEEAGQSLLGHDWPGNLRQLAAVVAHAAMLADGAEIGQADVAGLLGGVRPQADCETIPVPLAAGLKEMESVIINEVIRRCRGNKAAAARALKLHRRTLYRLLEE